MIISWISSKKIAKSEIRYEISDKLRIKLNEVYSEKDFEKLPGQLRSYFKAAGYIGKPIESNLHIIYDKAQIKMNTLSRDTGWEGLGKYNLEPVRQVAIDEDWAIRFRRVEFIKTITRAQNGAITEEARRRTSQKEK